MLFGPTAYLSLLQYATPANDPGVAMSEDPKGIEHDTSRVGTLQVVVLPLGTQAASVA
jgi:hypothetical protein